MIALAAVVGAGERGWSAGDLLRPMARDERSQAVSSGAHDARRAALLIRRIERLTQARAVITDPHRKRVAILGDKHGRARVLKELVVAAARRAIDGVVMLGDAYTRGKNNSGVYRAMFEGMTIDKKQYGGLYWILPGRAVFCIGNHEAMIIRTMLLDAYVAPIIKRYFHGRRDLEHYCKKIHTRISELERGTGNAEELLQLQRAQQWLVQDGGAELLKELKSERINPVRFARTIAERYALFHYDQLGYLNVHAGFVLDENGRPSIETQGLAELDRAWKKIQRGMKDNAHFFKFEANRKSVADIFERARPLIGVRMPEWFDKIVIRVEIAPAARDGVFTYLQEHTKWDKGTIRKRWIDWLIATDAQAQAGSVHSKKILEQLAMKYGVTGFTVLPAPRVNRELADTFEDAIDANGVHFAHTPRQTLLIGGIEFINHDLTHTSDGYTILTDQGFVFREAGVPGETVIVSREALLKDIDGRIAAARALLAGMGPAPAAGAGTVASTALLRETGCGALRPLARGERIQDTVPLLNIDDFVFLEHLTEFNAHGRRSGLSRVLSFQYRRGRPPMMLPNGVMLRPGGVYVIKFALSQDRCETYIVPTKKFLQDLNPGNNNRNLPVLVGYVDLAESTYFGGDLEELEGQGIVTEFINGETMKSRLEHLPGAARKERRDLVRNAPDLMLRVVRRFKEVFVDHGYFHGDLDLCQVMIREKDGEPVFFDVDTITPQGYSSLDEPVIRRRRLVYSIASSDRKLRIDNKQVMSTDRLCLSRDDIYSLCDMLATYCAGACSEAEKLRETVSLQTLNAMFVAFTEYAAIAMSDAEYDAEEKRGGVLDVLISELERIMGILASPAPVPVRPLAGSAVLRPLAFKDRLPDLSGTKAVTELFETLYTENTSRSLASYARLGMLWIHLPGVKARIEGILTRVDIHPDVRQEAAHALAPLVSDDQDARSAVIAGLAHDKSATVRTTCADILNVAAAAHEDARVALLARLAMIKENPLVRKACAEALGLAADEHEYIRTELSKILLEDYDRDIRCACANALALVVVGGKEPPAALIAGLKTDKDEGVISACADALAPAVMQHPDVRAALCNKFKSAAYESVCIACARALAPVITEGEDVREVFRCKLIVDPGPVVNAVHDRLFFSLMMDDRRVREDFLRTLKSKTGDGSRRVIAATALSRVITRHRSARTALRRVLADDTEKNLPVRQACADALAPMVAYNRGIRRTFARILKEGKNDAELREICANALASAVMTDNDVREALREVLVRGGQENYRVLFACAHVIAPATVRSGSIRRFFIRRVEKGRLKGDVLAAYVIALEPALATDADARKAVCAALKTNGSSLVRQRCARILKQVAAADRDVRSTLTEALVADPEQVVRQVCVEALEPAFVMHEDACIAVCDRLMSDHDPSVRKHCINALAGMLMQHEHVRTVLLNRLINDPHWSVRKACAMILAPAAAEYEDVRKALVAGLREDKVLSVRQACCDAVAAGLAGSLGKAWALFARHHSDIAAYHTRLNYLYSFAHRRFIEFVQGPESDRIVPIGWGALEPIAVSAEGPVPMPAYQRRAGRTYVVDDASGPGATFYKDVSDERLRDVREEAAMLNSIYPGSGARLCMIDLSGTPVRMLIYHVPDRDEVLSYPPAWKDRRISAATLRQWNRHTILQLRQMVDLGRGYTGLCKMYHSVSRNLQYNAEFQPAGMIRVIGLFDYANDRAGGEVYDVSPEHMAKAGPAGFTARTLARVIRDQVFQLSLLCAYETIINPAYTRDDLRMLLEGIAADMCAAYDMPEKSWEKLLNMSDLPTMETIITELDYALRHRQDGTDLGYPNHPISCPGIIALAETVARTVVEGLLVSSVPAKSGLLPDELRTYNADICVMRPWPYRDRRTQTAGKVRPF